MSWPASLGVALVTATVGLLLSGFVANLAVGWYHVPGFEGEAGYFVVAYALLGFLVGGGVGLVAARAITGSESPGFLKALGLSLGALLALVALVGGTARALADVPPTLDGETLLLAIELRWPPGRAPDRGDTTERVVRLGSVTRGHVQRASELGPLWLEDAHEVDGRWVAPGAVRVFTSRGTRAIDVDLGDSTHPGFIVPLPARPGRAQLRWSEWLPRAKPGAPPLPADVFTYRFRVVRASEPIRTETIGPFAVQTIASAFYDGRSGPGPATLSAAADFAIRHAGQRDAMRADGVAAIAGTTPALLVHVADPESEGRCVLLAASAQGPRATTIGECVQPFDVAPLTNDVATFHAAKELTVPRGRIDRTTFARPGLYLLHDLVLDTRTLTVHRFTIRDDVPPMPSVPPLGVSPDARSIVRFTFTESDMRGATLVVTDVVADTTYTLPIDAARTHFQKYEMLDPGWVAHYFEWRREHGVDRLVERTPVAPLPYRGQLSLGAAGAYYWLEPAREGLRDAMLAFLVQEMHGERQPKGEQQFAEPVRVNGAPIEVSYGASDHYVNVSLAHGAKDTAVIAEIARRFDAALATGRYDALFGR